jgi:alkylation response protein AidB-like acyl-CoA dehydrogenase
MMNFEPSDDQAMIAETFARFFEENSSMARVRAAMPSGFDPELWRSFAEMGGFGIRVPEAQGGSGLGLFDAVLVLEEAGRSLASGPVAEAMVAARILAACGDAGAALLGKLIVGDAVVTIALHDAADTPAQWVAGGAVADTVIARDGTALYLVVPTADEKQMRPNLASTPMARIALDAQGRTLLSDDSDALHAFDAGVEEWKLLIAATLAGLSGEALRLASAYASERVQFGQLIGTFQGISHPLGDLKADTDGGKFLVWRAIRDIADSVDRAGAEVSLALWWNARTAGRAVAQALHTFGGYGLSTDYDIHLYNLRAKALPLILGDPVQLLEEAGRRLYHGETATLPQVGDVSVEFDFGDEARALAAEVDAFFEANLTPELRARAHYSFDGHVPEFHKKIAEAGLHLPSWPKEYGGRDANAYASHAAYAAWEKHGWTTHAVGVTGLVGTMIRMFGSDELKDEVLSRIIAGDCICSLGFSEPASGSDVFAAKTRATPDGNGWRIDGQKMFTSGANMADYVLMLARTDPDSAKHRGLTMFIVPLKAEGVEIQPVYTFQDERTNITFYDGVRIPDSWRLGGVNEGARVMSQALGMEHGASWDKTQWHMLREAETFCRDTKRRGIAMIEDDKVATRLARVVGHNLITEMLGWRAMWAAVEAKPHQGQGSMGKLFSSEAFLHDSADLLDLCAPESLTETTGPAAYINLSYRHAQGTTIYGGTSEVHRSVVAERALNLPRTRA